MWKRNWPIILVLIVAFGLRFYDLVGIPPGLTHDEANHGREAIGILDGILLFYFPLNYGSEPLYSYTAAFSMALLGENLLALRLVNVIFGTAVIGLMYAWVCRAFERRLALVTAVLLAVSFWPLATSRQALRAGMLPFFMTGAVWFFWLLLRREQTSEVFRNLGGFFWPAVGFGLCLAITLHIYLAARVAWLLFPAFLLYLLLFHRHTFRRVWLPAVGGLLLAGALVTPMFFYLQRYPYALTRLDMLDGPLQAVRAGELLPVLQNSAEALLAFIWPGYGDHFLAYNIPGRPVLNGVTAVFFISGLLAALWRWRQMNYAFVLLWFGIGILPSLITGPTANTTRNLAALPVTFVFPALGFWAAGQLVMKRLPGHGRALVHAGLAIWLVSTGLTTVWAYFGRWAQSPEVRGAYQVNMVRALQEGAELESPVVMSTVYPGPAHDPSIGLVLGAAEDYRWLDVRYALVLPRGQDARIIIPASTPPHRAFRDFLTAGETVQLRADDLDPSFTTYNLSPDGLAAYPLDTDVNLNNALTLRHLSWLRPMAQPGETAELLTIWQVTDPAAVGPIVPPAFTTDAVMFTQVLGADGRPFAQQDSLEAPSWSWQAGDIILQIHPVSLPPDLPAGSYPVIVGWYDRLSGQRLAVLDESGQPVDDKVSGPALEVNTP